MTYPSTLRPARQPKSLSPIVRRFAEEMQWRLDSSGRTGYQNLPYSVLMDGVRRNTNELREALMDRESEAREAVTASAADLANYAMFVAINNIFKNES